MRNTQYAGSLLASHLSYKFGTTWTTLLCVALGETLDRTWTQGRLTRASTSAYPCLQTPTRYFRCVLGATEYLRIRVTIRAILPGTNLPKTQTTCILLTLRNRGCSSFTTIAWWMSPQRTHRLYSMTADSSGQHIGDGLDEPSSRCTVWIYSFFIMGAPFPSITTQEAVIIVRSGLGRDTWCS